MMASPGTGMALFAMALGVLVIANDFTALNVALPAIEQDFDVDVGTVQWVLAGTESGEAAFADFRTSVADEVLDVVRDSFVAGVQLSFRVVAAIAVLGLVVALLGVRPEGQAPAETPDPPRTPDPAEPSPDPAERSAPQSPEPA